MNALFPEEGWWNRARAAYTGMGATPNQLLGPIGDTQFLSDADGQSFVPMEQAQRAERAKRAKQQGEDLLGFVGGIRGWHGSPHKFDRFDLSKIGTGEGAQVFGHGAYIAGREGTAQFYADVLGQEKSIPTKILKQYYQPGNVVLLNDGSRARVIDFYPDLHSAKLQRIDLANEPIGNAFRTDQKPLVSNINTVFASRGIPPYKASHMYEVEIKTEPNRLLDWDKPFPQQSPYVQERTGDFVEESIRSMNAARERMRPKIEEKLRQGLPLSQRDQELLRDMSPERIPGSKIYSMQEVSHGAMRPGEKGAETAEYFRTRGIPGIQYLDAGSRAGGEGTRNYVMFDTNLIDILRRYGTLGPVGAGVVNQLMGTSDDTR